MKLLRLLGIISFSLSLVVFGGSNVCAMDVASIGSSSSAASSSTLPVQKVCAICHAVLADTERLPIAPCGHEINVHSACLTEHPQHVLCPTCNEAIPESCPICAASFTERASNGQALPRATKLLNCRHGLSFHEDCVFQVLTINNMAPQRCPLCSSEDAINVVYFERLLHDRRVLFVNHGRIGAERVFPRLRRFVVERVFPRIRRFAPRLRERLMRGAEAGLREGSKVLVSCICGVLLKAYLSSLRT